MPRSDFSSSCGSEKLYGNALIDPPNGLARCGEFVSVITSCRSASRRRAMYLPDKPKAPVTAIRTLAFHQADKTSSQVITKLRSFAPKITHSACYRNAPKGQLFNFRGSRRSPQISANGCARVGAAPPLRFRGSGRSGHRRRSYGALIKLRSIVERDRQGLTRIMRPFLVGNGDGRPGSAAKSRSTRLSTEAQVEDGKSVTSSAQPNCAS